MPAVADVEGETVRLVVELQVLFVGGGAVHAAGLFAVFVQSEAGADEGVCAVTDGEFGLDAVANGARQGAAVCAGMVEGLGLGAVVAGSLDAGGGEEDGGEGEGFHGVCASGCGRAAALSCRLPPRARCRVTLRVSCW